MEQPYRTTTGSLPSIRSWSKNSDNRCLVHALPMYWNDSDAVTFLADVGMYHPSLLNGLDDAEKEHVLKFKSEYFKKRFVVSRSLLKSILVHLPGTGNRDDLVFSKEKKRILVAGAGNLFISLSYSGNSLALTIAKRKIGSDIEMVHPVDLKKVRSSPLFDHAKSKNKKEESLHAIHVWTVVEAYAKLRDQNPYPLLNNSCLLQDAGFLSYCIDKRMIMSLSYDTGTFNHTMFWIDSLDNAPRVQNRPALHISHFPR